jgi:hypothetical protein
MNASSAGIGVSMSLAIRAILIFLWRAIDHGA